ncbi:ankyrin repeat domain-containing protein [Rhodovibrio salinarum]|uniref:Ankyrin repeat domain-containing protein n=1 Tax=Rhodovibrio salinarum TaxID=1087 RepID=A0A934V0C1_9PROT|nr:ankyrin repeat domain-containing protein [Rhodovibrio salinarum]MBK1697270.1 ankyrin repeat domain-containing protein [Rhodovibrio salinarum]
MAAKDDLLQAAETGDTEAASAALDTGALPDVGDRYGVTALLRAAGRGDQAMVDLLLARGAQVDKGSAQDNTPLMLAAARGHREVVARLLRAGANPAHRNKWHFTARDWAQWSAGSSDVVAMLDAAHGR